MRGRGALWVSTSTHTRGGVATYVRTMQRTPLWDLWSIRHVVTHRNGSVGTRAATFAEGLLAYLRELLLRRPAVVHLHTASYGSFARKAMLAWTARAFRIPTVIHVHGAGFEDFYDRSPRLVRHVIRMTLEAAGAVIALGDTWALILRQIAPRARVAVVPNAVEPSTPVEQPGPGELVQVLFLGEIEERKGAFLLLEAWSLLPSETKAVARLVMAGGGAVSKASTMVHDLELDDSIRVTGHLAPAEVEDLLRESHVLVLPSSFEGQPMAILEGMAHGHCVVTTSVGGIADLVGDCGVYVPVGDREALGSALRSVVVDAGRRTELGGRAFERVRDKFDVNQTWRSLSDLYEELVR